MLSPSRPGKRNKSNDISQGGLRLGRLQFGPPPQQSSQPAQSAQPAPSQLEGELNERDHSDTTAGAPMSDQHPTGHDERSGVHRLAAEAARETDQLDANEAA